jgi:hypothetical protein
LQDTHGTLICTLLYAKLAPPSPYEIYGQQKTKDLLAIERFVLQPLKVHSNKPFFP